MSNALTPDIRFKGFADDWVKHLISELGRIETGNTPSTANKSFYEDDGFLWVTPSDITEDIIKSTAKQLSAKGKKEARIAGTNSILCTCIASIGKNAFTPTECAFNQQINAVLPFADYDPYFLFVDSFNWSKIMKRNAGALTFQIVNKAEFSTIETIIPQEIIEQRKIASLIYKLNELIGFNINECKKIMDIKKSMLINMFPQGDEKVPRIRFKGFSGDWNYPVLGTLGKTYTGLSGKTKEDFGNGYATYITYMNVFTNPITNLLQVDSIESDAMQNEVQEGDIFFTTSSETPEEVGMSSVLLVKSGTTYLNSFCFGYRLNENVKIDKYYLAYLLRSPVVREKIVFLAQGISRFNISKTKMMEIAIPVPEKTEEQEKIGAFFFNLDKLIKAQEKKIAQLKNIKSALLNKMFPKGDE